MKKIYKILLPIIAVIITVAGVWAMNAKKHISPKLTTYYYKYIPNQASLSMYKTASNWSQISDPEEEACQGSQIPCIVTSNQSTVASFVSSIVTKNDVESAALAQKDGTELP